MNTQNVVFVLFSQILTSKIMIQSRILSILGITTMTGIICLQDKTKKGIAFTNFIKSFYSSDVQPSLEKMYNGIETIKQNANQSIQKVKQDAQALKEKGNGSYFIGIKNTYGQQQSNEERNEKLLNKSTQIADLAPKKTLWSQKMKNAVEKVKENTSQGIEKVKHDVQALKDKGNGSYIDGIKNTYKGYQIITKSNATKQENTQKKKWFPKIRSIYQQLKQQSHLKSQKLVTHHIQFASMSILGSLFMPFTFFSLTVGYVVAYEFYYFTSSNKNKKLLDFQQFTPIWSIFMLGGFGIFGVKFLKTFKALKNGKQIF